MSLGVILDVAIGLVFTYLLMAIIVSALLEMIAGWLKWRGKDMRIALAGLLGAEKHPLLETLFRQVVQHGLISGTAANALPSYIPSRNFALVLADILKQDGGAGTAFSRIQAGIQALPGGTVKQTLSAFVTEAAGDADALQKRLETWFDDAMDRTTGAYKRNTQVWTLLIAFAAAAILNVDSFAVARTLWSEPAKRNAIVAAAQQYASKDALPNGEAKQRMKDATCELDKLALPIGWTSKKAREAACTEAAAGTINLSDTLDAIKERFAAGGWGWMVVGWILTAMAVSFGAPFWFDALKNLINIRNAGPKPPRAEAEGASR